MDEQILQLNAREKPAPSANLAVETVLDVHHWTRGLFSFRTTRSPSFRFQSGQFTMIGLMVDGRPLLRAYSMASASYADELEFLSIKVPDGPLTSRLQAIVPGDPLLVGRKATGTLLMDHLPPGRALWLLGTGTGLAPFLALVRDPDVYERYERVVLVHGVRQIGDLAYRRFLADEIRADEVLGDTVANRLVYLPVVTRDRFERVGRIPQLLRDGRLQADAGLPNINPGDDRVMLCGSPEFLKDTRALLDSELGFAEASHSRAGSFVVERAFVER